MGVFTGFCWHEVIITIYMYNGTLARFLVTLVLLVLVKIVQLPSQAVIDLVFILISLLASEVSQLSLIIGFVCILFVCRFSVQH